MVTEWHERRVNDVLVVDIKGALTIGKQELREQFDSLYERGEKKVLVNMAGVLYMDSTSVGDLIVGHLQAAKNGAVFKIANVPPKIVELLTMHHLIEVFDAHADEDSAVASFS